MRLIDADEVKQLFNPDACISTDTNADKVYVRGLIDAIPTIDAEPIRHGKWEKIKSGDWANATEYRCSECGKYRLAVNPVNYNWNYCPNCGAEMDGGTE